VTVFNAELFPAFGLPPTLKGRSEHGGEIR